MRSLPGQVGCSGERGQPASKAAKETKINVLRAFVSIAGTNVGAHSQELNPVAWRTFPGILAPQLKISVVSRRLRCYPYFRKSPNHETRTVNQKLHVILLAAFASSALHAAQVTNVIDNLTTAQSLQTENSTSTNTSTAAGAIGGFRTAVLYSAGNNEGEPTGIAVSAGTQRMSLATPDGATSNFQLLWGGANGTAGLGGVDFGAGQPLDIFTSVLSFSLRSTDQASNFTWTFTDTLSNSASYTGTFAVHSSTNPPLEYNILLSSFSNSPAVNWNSIDFIVLSGGGVDGLDMSIPAPFAVVASTVPEPSTWMLFASGLVLAIIIVRRQVTRRT